MAITESQQQKLDRFDSLVDENRELANRVNQMCDDYDENCEEAFRVAQDLRRALDLINEGCRLIVCHASSQLVADTPRAKQKRKKRHVP